MKKKILFLFVFLSFILLFYPLFLKKTFGPVSFEQFIFHLMNPLKGSDIRLYYKGIGYAIILPLLLTCIYMYPSFFLPKKLKKLGIKWQKSKWQSLFSIVLFLFSLIFQLSILRIDIWYYGYTHPTTLFRDFYTVPQPSEVTFKEKRNAIVIYLESMETTYSDISVFQKDYTPELTKLSKQNTSFDGFHQFPGTQWTVASLVSGMCGIQLKIPMKGVRMDLFETFLPNAVCIPEILQKHGYHTGFIIGSDLEFSGLDNFVNQHGFDHAWGVHEIEEEKGKMTPDMKGHGWGLNDEAMFIFAKEKIGKAAQQKSPFFYVLMTIDTHFPNGYFNPRRCTRQENNFTDVIRCSSQTVSDFIKWIQSQPFAKETAIIVLGDHLTMGNDVYSMLSQSRNRQVVNIFINGSKKTLKQNQRHFGAFDFAPSILSFMGSNLPNDSFGLGRDLFSSKPTLAEELTVEKIQRELTKYSREYQSFF